MGQNYAGTGMESSPHDGLAMTADGQMYDPSTGQQYQDSQG